MPGPGIQVGACRDITQMYTEMLRNPRVAIQKKINFLSMMRSYDYSNYVSNSELEERNGQIIQFYPCTLDCCWGENTDG